MGALCCRDEKIDLNAEVELQHFNLLRSVGKGAFGKVRVVQHKGSKKIYALKYINKAKCIQMRAVENIIQERRLLEEIENNFICNLRYAFQDDENLFMVIDLMLGGDLRFHLDRMGVFSEEMIRLYTAEISCGLSYLHSKRIVHRDLKPDNILLCEAGHAHLTDFNIAVRFREDRPLTAVAGSMAYMAPEVLNKKGYFASVDWWSLGVILYEVAVGKRPFRAKTNEGLTHAIMHEDVIFGPGSENLNPDLMDMIQQFITRDVRQRLGTKESGGVGRLREHPFFTDVDWNLIENKTSPPPFVPDSKRANFDATHELEELLLEDNPLKAKPRKKKKEHVETGEPETALAKEMRIMEEKFTVYDFSKINRTDPTKEPSSNPADTRDLYEGKEHIMQVVDKTPGEGSQQPQQQQQLQQQSPYGRG
ncbi:kinase-like domain-containing protein [Entophlyctis helioformis]|nr:kinase-like domain-containing protein [Entophlyctis helioformis]